MSGKFIVGIFIDFTDSPILEKLFIALLTQKNPAVSPKTATIVHKIIFFLFSGKFCSLVKKILIFSALFIIHNSKFYGCSTTISIAPSFGKVESLTTSFSCGVTDGFPIVFKNFETSSSFDLDFGKA